MLEWLIDGWYGCLDRLVDWLAQRWAVQSAKYGGRLWTRAEALAELDDVTECLQKEREQREPLVRAAVAGEKLAATVGSVEMGWGASQINERLVSALQAWEANRGEYTPEVKAELRRRLRDESAPDNGVEPDA